MNKTLIALAAGLITLSAVSAQAAPQNQNRPAQERQQERQQERSDNRNEHRDNYGSWQSSWGSRPPAPPAHFKRTSNWYAHVRACQQRYRSYNPRTDRYTVRAGRTAICSL
ncbi:hypothetical protein LTR94_024716 [Friedmanniomyces endolithicus]|nr:hypothetical protein LTR94_024716 [Friedmanniomyces endolithicus]